MTVTIPESVTAEGNVKIVFLPALADPAAPSAAALVASTAVDVSCFLMPDWGGITGTQAVGDDRRFCSKESYQRLGRITRTVAPMTYTYLPQETDSHAANKARAALEEGNTGWLVVGYGVDPADSFTTGDLTRSVPVECGYQNHNAAAADEFAPLTITQTLGVVGPEVAGTVVA